MNTLGDQGVFDIINMIAEGQPAPPPVDPVFPDRAIYELPAKLPVAGTMLFVRGPSAKRGFWVKFERIEVWANPQTGKELWAYIGLAAAKKRGAEGFTVDPNATTAFAAEHIVKPKLYTSARHDRLCRIAPHVPGDGGNVRLQFLAEAAGYTHILGAYSSTKSLKHEFTIERGEDGQLLVHAQIPTPNVDFAF